MAEYITSTSTSTSSLHSSPNRKRTRESLTTRSSSYLPSCKSAATASSNVEVMELLESDVPISSSITQPRSSIHSVNNGFSSMKAKKNISNSSITSSNCSPTQSPISVSILNTFVYKQKTMKSVCTAQQHFPISNHPAK